MLTIQRIAGWLVFLPVWYLVVGLLKYRQGYSIRNHQLVIKQYIEIAKSNSPLLVCSNHLTLIDSVILHWAFGTPFWYLFNYRSFLWNVPARENAHRKLSWSILTFLGKCLFIDRNGGSKHSSAMLDKITGIIKDGDSFLIFPEGTRSRSGEVVVEQVTYGIGKIIQNLPGLKVLCVYLRGDQQAHYSDFPHANDTFTIKMRLAEPSTQYSGLRATKDYSLQVIKTIKQLEVEYWQERNSQETYAKVS